MTASSFHTGDIVYADFSPQAGHEQRGRRPALIVSNEQYHRLTNLVIVCPITNTDRDFPLHIALDARTETTGYVLCEQERSLDPIARNLTFKEKAPGDIVERVVDIIKLFL